MNKMLSIVYIVLFIAGMVAAGMAGAALGEYEMSLITDNKTNADHHREACEAGKSTYRDVETGRHVMTELFLLERGYCCNSACRHCPYPINNKLPIPGDPSQKGP